MPRAIRPWPVGRDAQPDPAAFAAKYRNRAPFMFEATASAAGADGKALLATLASAPAAAESEQLVDILCALDGRRFLKHELTSHVSAPLASSMEEILYTRSENIIHQRKYLRAYLDQVPAWRANLQPVLEQLGSMTGRDFCEKNVGIWVSSAGCETPLHFDLCHGFLVQCTGRKTFLLAPPSDTGCLYWSADSTAGSKNRTTSPVDLFAWTRGDEEQQKMLIAEMDKILAVEESEEEFPNEAVLEVRAGAGGEEEAPAPAPGPPGKASGGASRKKAKDGRP